VVSEKYFNFGNLWEAAKPQPCRATMGHHGPPWAKLTMMISHLMVWEHHLKKNTWFRSFKHERKNRFEKKNLSVKKKASAKASCLWISKSLFPSAHLSKQDVQM
jgi:hypothetical protein